MANQLYATAVEGLLKDEIILASHAVYAYLVNIAGGHYVVNIASDKFLNAIASGDRVAATSAVASKTLSGRVFDFADPAGGFGTVATGPALGAIVIVADPVGDVNAATMRLVAYIDSATGLPVTPDGTTITFALNASGLWTIG